MISTPASKAYLVSLTYLIVCMSGVAKRVKDEVILPNAIHLKQGGDIGRIPDIYQGMHFGLFKVRHQFSSLNPATPIKLISVNESSGKLEMLKPLVKEKICPSSKECAIFVNISTTLAMHPVLLRLTVFLEDDSTCAPVFNFRTLIGDISEPGYIEEAMNVRYAVEVGFSNADVSCQDVTFEMKAYGKGLESPELYEELYGAFTVEKFYNNYYIKPILKQLDRELYVRYLFSFTACGKGNSSKCSDGYFQLIVLDKNDNSPTFRHFKEEIVVSKATKSRTVVHKIMATDKDSAGPPVYWYKNGTVGRSRNGIIAYSITAGDKQYFRIGQKTGRIKLRKSLDGELRNFLRIVVTATDGGFPPRNSSKSIWIKLDNSSIEELCATNSSVACNSTHDKIYENEATYLKPQSIISASVGVLVFVKPLTNNTRISAEINKDKPITNIKALCLQICDNSRIRYFIVGGNKRLLRNSNHGNDLFIINQSTGVLRLNYTEVDFNNYIGTYTITVMAIHLSDRSSSSSVDIHVTLISTANQSVTKSVALLAASFLLLLVVLSGFVGRWLKQTRMLKYDCEDGTSSYRAYLSPCRCTYKQHRDNDNESDIDSKSVKSKYDDEESQTSACEFTVDVNLVIIDRKTNLSVKRIDLDNKLKESSQQQVSIASNPCDIH